MPTDKTPATATNAVYLFGEFEARAESGELFRNGVVVRIQEQSLQVLLALLENPGGVVTRDQLRARLWPRGTYVDFEHSLNAAVKRLRAALEDDADRPRYIETLPRRGYRLIVEVSQSGTPATVGGQKAQPTLVVNRRRSVRLVVIVITLAMLGIVVTVGLFSRRGVGGPASTGTVTPPQKSEAYELYLRSLSYKREGPANQQAIVLLERSTSIDSRSSLSWYELARRYSVEFTTPTELSNTGGGQRFLEQAQEANRRALELAPHFSPARLQQVSLQVWGGQVIPAYRAALAMTDERPQDANAHYALSFVLRYGGMYEEAASECDQALKLDPSNDRLLQCALVNVLLGRYDRAQTFLDVDPFSYLVHYRRMELAILRNDRKAALEEARSIRVGPNTYFDARMMEAALAGADSEKIRKWSRAAEGLFDRVNTAEFYLVEARYQSYAGQTEPALRLLKRAIANQYCSFPVMETDPFLANVRRRPEYNELRVAGIACRDNFRAQIRK